MIKEKFSLINKHGIITGASRGIGRAMAEGLAEMGADLVTVLHIHPVANKEFTERVTSKYLSDRFTGQGVMDTWKQLVDRTRFATVSVEHLLQLIVKARSMADPTWVRYLQTRYTFAPRITPKV